VFTSTFDGHIYAFATRDGRTAWQTRAPAGINACPTVSGKLLLVPAGVPRAHGVGRLLAFGLPK
jgi:outer membrane protein assembly factor BamB